MDLGTATFNKASFVQTSEEQLKRSQAADLLKAVAQKVNSPRLAAFALRMRLDAFTKVKAAIDDMIAELMKQSADEIKQKDFCVDEFNQNQLQTEKKDSRENRPRGVDRRLKDDHRQADQRNC